MEARIPPLEQIDAVLKYLTTDKGHSSFTEIMKGINNIFSIEGPDLNRILNKLESESYVHVDSFYYGQNDIFGSQIIDKRYSITFDGNLFNQKGGYKRKYEIENLAIQEAKLRDERSERNENRLVIWTRNLFWGTVAVAIGAVGLIVWEIIKTFYVEKLK